MGLNRYYVPSLPASGSTVLPDDELHHAFHVRRESVGNQITAFDGLGNEAHCVITAASKKQIQIVIESLQHAPRVLEGNIVLGIAMPKGDRQRLVIEKACELGIHRLVPLVCERSNWDTKDAAIEKWKRFVIESCKQCERNQLLEIDSPIRFEKWLTNIETSNAAPDQLSFLVHPDIPAEIKPWNLAKLASRLTSPPRLSSLAFSIGPKAGFSPKEVQLAIDHHYQLLQLGPRILRVETAVAAVAAIANCHAPYHSI